MAKYLYIRKNFGYKHLGHKTLLLLLMFTYVYQLNLNFLPATTNRLLGVLGMILYLCQNIRERYNFYLIPKLFKILKLYFGVIVVSAITILVNGTTEFYYMRMALSYILAIFSVYPIAILYRKIYGKIEFNKVVEYFVVVAILQLILSLLMYFDASLFSFFTSLINYNEIAISALEQSEGFRLIGFGTAFFGSGIIHGFILILMSFYYYNKRLKISESIIFFLLFSFIFIVGMFMARTVLVGALLALLLITLKFFSSMRLFLKTLFSFSFLAITVIAFVDLYGQYYFSDLEMLFSFGFEMFNNYMESNAIETSSTNSLFEMYQIVPNNLKTWLIGDGLWMNPNGLEYYMNTDVGYFRSIFYFGLIGLIFLIVFQYKFLSRVFFRNDLINPRKCILILFLYYLLLNFKGTVDLFFLSIIFSDTNRKYIFAKSDLC